MGWAPSAAISLKTFAFSLAFPLNVAILSDVLFKGVSVISVFTRVFMIAWVIVVTLVMV